MSLRVRSRAPVAWSTGIGERNVLQELVGAIVINGARGVRLHRCSAVDSYLGACQTDNDGTNGLELSARSGGDHTKRDRPVPQDHNTRGKFLARDVCSRELCVHMDCRIGQHQSA